MRSLLLAFTLMFFSSVKAQSVLPATSSELAQRSLLENNHAINDSIPNKKLFLTTYSGITTGYIFFNRGSAFYIAAPIGLQLNRKLNNNLYAFAGISAAPAYMNFNSSFMSADVNKMYPNSSFIRTNNFGINARAEMGLMYINDAKTFSISGSFSIERSSNPIFLNQPVNTTRLNSPVYQNR